MKEQHKKGINASTFKRELLKPMKTPGNKFRIIYSE